MHFMRDNNNHSESYVCVKLTCYRRDASNRRFQNSKLTTNITRRWWSREMHTNDNSNEPIHQRVYIPINWAVIFSSREHLWFAMKTLSRNAEGKKSIDLFCGRVENPSINLNSIISTSIDTCSLTSHILVCSNILQYFRVTYIFNDIIYREKSSKSYQ